MKSGNQSNWRFALAITPPVIAFALQWIFWSIISPFAWFLFYPAIFFSAWIGGLIPGLIATLASGLLVLWFFIPPQFTLGSKTPMEYAAVAVFFLLGTLFSVMFERQKRAAERAEEAGGIVKANEENLAVTLDSIGDAVITTDAEGRVARMNPVAVVLTGWPRKEAVGRPVGEIFRIINHQTRQPAENPVAAALAEGAIQSLVNGTLLITRDGREIPVADSCAPIKNAEGRVIGAVLVFREVTRENEAKQALRDSAARIQSILNTVMDGIVSIDERGIVETMNPAAERIFGYSSSEVVGKNVSMLMPEPYRGGHDGYIERYLATNDAHIIGRGREVPGLRKDGGTFPLDLAVSEMRLGGSRHFTGILRDITERKRAEEALFMEKDKAVKANRAKDSFLATMSHEIRTPLTGMLGMLELLSLTRLDEEQRATLDAAWDSGRGLLRIVSDILDWSKIEEGKLELAPCPASIPQLLQEVVNTYSRTASAKSLTLYQNSDARLGRAHIVDPLRLTQVLNNFVSNAIKFTRHGEVEVRAELVEALPNAERVRFSVRDTGIGIARSAQEQLFQRYQQGSADTARMYGGTGLGLSICRRLAEMMDGSIELKSEEGLGSIFSIVLTMPLAETPVEKKQVSHPEVKQRAVKPLFADGEQAPLILAVDDTPINRNLLSRQIRMLGLGVDTAGSGEEALEMWRNNRYALVITDCHMPEMDGYALTQAIRRIESQESRARMPVIAWTANALAEESGRCQTAGMDDLLVKPTDMTQLRNTLMKWLKIPEEDQGRAKPSGPEGRQAPPPIDFSVLNAIVEDSSEIGHILRDFQAQVREEYSLLDKLLERDDLDAVKNTAHRMKGASRMVGAVYLAAACDEIEQAAGNGDAATAAHARGNLEKAVRQFDAHMAASDSSA